MVTRADTTEGDVTLSTEATSRPRFYLGVMLLLLVDIIWVGSSEATRYLFKDYDYNKPYMSTYIKISMFSIYLLGFVLCSSWRRQFIICACDDYPGQYQLVRETDTEDTDDGIDHQDKNSLGESEYLPAHLPSTSELDSASDSEKRRKNRVKFNNVMEVKHLEDSEDARIARMNHRAASLARFQNRTRRPKLTVQQVVRISFYFTVIFFLGNIAYQEALAVTEVAVVNIMSSTSGIFTLFLAAAFPCSEHDKFTLTKLLVVFISFSGLVLVTLGSSTNNPLHDLTSNLVLSGITWSLLGAFCYASYIVFLRKAVGADRKLDVPMFFGFVGLFCLTLFWPGLAILNYFNLEPFQLPDHLALIFLLVNGIVGTVMSELLWLWGCLFTSSLIGTMALTLTIPLSVVMDILLRHIEFSWMFYVGASCVFFSFVAIAYLSHRPTNDPVLNWIKSCCRALCCCCGSSRTSDKKSKEHIPLTSLNRYTSS